LKKFQSGAHTALGGAAESSKLKIAGAATLQRDREMNNKSDLSLSKKPQFSNPTNNIANEANEWLSGSFGKLNDRQGHEPKPD
jgi:hypothetical protein|tara:strand:- start:1150 stop:1398 length:249 start_codon:yes stop_codon:yes gene_type:complete